MRLAVGVSPAVWCGMAISPPNGAARRYSRRESNDSTNITRRDRRIDAMNIYRTDCRDCGKLVRRRLDRDGQQGNNAGIRIRCRRCGTTNFAPKYTKAEDLDA